MFNVTWIGTGVMGGPMARRLAEAGYKVTLYNRTKAKAQKVADSINSINVEVSDDIKKAIKDADFIFTLVGYPKDVEQVMLDEDGIIANAKDGAIVIDMTTSSPDLAKKIFEIGQNSNIEVLDAPVSGGDIGAENGTLTIMVGGSKAAYDKVLPLFNLMGKTINYMGEAGNGQHTKAANQIAVAGANAAYTEALVYGLKAGLDLNTMLKAISGGAAGSWQMDNSAPKVVAGDFNAVFFVDYFVKDLKIAKEEIENKGIQLPMLNAVLDMYEKYAKSGHGKEGTQALIKEYLQVDNIEL